MSLLAKNIIELGLSRVEAGVLTVAQAFNGRPFGVHGRNKIKAAERLVDRGLLVKVGQSEKSITVKVAK